MIGCGLGISFVSGGGPKYIFVADFTKNSAGYLAGGSGASTAFETAYGLRLVRASVATVQSGTSTLVTGIPVNGARFGRRIDADPIGLVIEEPTTNLNGDSNFGSTFWSQNDGVRTLGYSATGPEGAATTTRLNFPTASAGPYLFAASTYSVPYSASVFHKSTGGGSIPNSMVFASAGTGSRGRTMTIGAAWLRAEFTATSVQDEYVYPLFTADFSSGGGVTASARDALMNYMQIERLPYCTEPVITTGATATRAVDLLWIVTQTQVDSVFPSGRVTMEVRLQPKGARASYLAPISLYASSQSAPQDACSISNTTGLVSLNYQNVGYTSSTAVTWAANDIVDFYVDAGGGQLPTLAYRVNGGSCVRILFTAGTVSAASIQAPLTFLSSTSFSPGTNVFTSRCHWIKTLAPGIKPGWYV